MSESAGGTLTTGREAISAAARFSAGTEETAETTRGALEAACIVYGRARRRWWLRDGRDGGGGSDALAAQKVGELICARQRP